MEEERDKLTILHTHFTQTTVALKLHDLFYVRTYRDAGDVVYVLVVHYVDCGTNISHQSTTRRERVRLSLDT